MNFSKVAPLFSLVTALALVGPCVVATQALDFQLRTTKVTEDGFTRDQECFSYDASNEVYFTLPGRWNRVDSPASLTLTSVDASNHLVRLEKSSTPAQDTDFKDKTGLDGYRRRAVGTVPQGATDVQIVEEHDLPLAFYHWRNYEFIVDYNFFGTPYRRSLVFLDLNAKEQILVTTVAPKFGFDGLRATAFSILRSWQVMPIQSP